MLGGAAFLVSASSPASRLMPPASKEGPARPAQPPPALTSCSLGLPPPRAPAAGLFQCSPGDIVLGAFLLLLLPVSFLAAGFMLLYRWLQHPQLNRRRAIFVLQRDPLAAAIAAHTPEATPRSRHTAALAAAAVASGTPGANGMAGAGAAAEGAATEGAAAEGAAGTSEDAAAAAAAALAVSSRRMAEAQARRQTFVGFSRSLFGEQQQLMMMMNFDGLAWLGLSTIQLLLVFHGNALCSNHCSLSVQHAVQGLPDAATPG